MKLLFTKIITENYSKNPCAPVPPKEPPNKYLWINGGIYNAIWINNKPAVKVIFINFWFLKLLAHFALFVGC